MTQYVDPVHLRQVLTQYYNEGELRTMCFDMGIDYESVGGRGKAEKVVELVAYAQRYGRLDKFADYVRQTRSFIQLRMTDTLPELPQAIPGSVGSGTTIYVQGDYMQGDKIIGDKFGGDEGGTNTKPADLKKLDKVLDSAIKKEVKVGESTIILVLVRDPNSKGLRFILGIESDYMLEEDDVRSSRVFQLNYPIDEFGNLLPTYVEIVIISPDFVPKKQSKIVEIDPNLQENDELNPIEFMLTPIITGQLQIIVEVHQAPEGISKKLGSKPMHTLSKDNPSPYIKHRVISLMLHTLGLDSQISQALEEPTTVYKVKGDLVQGDKMTGDKIKIGDISNSKGIAIGHGASAVAQDGPTPQSQPEQSAEKTGRTYNFYGPVTGSAIGESSVQAQNIAGGNITINYNEPQNRDEFAMQLAQLEALLKEAIANGEIEDDSAVEDVQDAIEEVQKPEPSSRRLKNRLEDVQEVVEGAVGVIDAARKAGSAVIKALPIVAGLIKVAQNLF